MWWELIKLGNLRYYNRGGNENVKKAIGWSGKTTSLHVQHVFIYFFAVTTTIKMPKFTFYGGR